MSVVIPTFTLQAGQPLGAGMVASATQLPVAVAALAATTGGTPLEIAEAGGSEQVPVPIPRLAGLDEVEVERLGFELWSDPFSQDVAVSGQGVAGGGLSLAYGGDGPAQLTRIDIEDLHVAAGDGQPLVVQGDGAAGGAEYVVYRWDGEAGRAVAEAGGDTAGAQHVHFMARPAAGSGFGPPAAAVPRFDMPGDAAGLYGPALGGAAMSLFVEDGRVRAKLRFTPALPAAGVQLFLGNSELPIPTAGLPNEVTAAGWSAETVRAVFDVRPAGVTVTAGTGGGEAPLVSRFDTDPGAVPIAVDFAPVARGLLGDAYPVSQGDDLGLALTVTADTPGNLRLRLGQARARYLRRPLPDAAARQLRGAPVTVELPLPAALVPSAVSFTVDGRYGPARLVAAADAAPGGSRHGFRVAGDVWLARRISLTAAERQLPLARAALFGRAGEAGELLLTLHGGDEARIGAALGEPVSLELAAAARPGWRRAELPSAPLPPHPPALWLVARATRGVFWWHGELGEPGPAQRSADGGTSWDTVDGRPTLQLAVLEVDPASGEPRPLLPLALGWEGGVLNADLVGVAGRGGLPADFRRFWLAEPADFLEPLTAAGEPLRLAFTCDRDVDLTVSDAVFTYDPWRS